MFFFVGQSLRTFAINFETALVYILVSHVRHLNVNSVISELTSSR